MHLLLHFRCNVSRALFYNKYVAPSKFFFTYRRLTSRVWAQNLALNPMQPSQKPILAIFFTRFLNFTLFKHRRKITPNNYFWSDENFPWAGSWKQFSPNCYCFLLVKIPLDFLLHYFDSLYFHGLLISQWDYFCYLKSSHVVFSNC
jgi:hypothetical protein